jgi:hypothetical protein
MTSAGSPTFPVTSACFNTSTVNGRKYSFFEFKPPARNMVIDVHNALFEYNIFIRWNVSSILHLFFYDLHYWFFVQMTSSRQINP